MQFRTLIKATGLLAAMTLIGCAGVPQTKPSNEQTTSEASRTNDQVVQIDLTWSRIGPLTSYDALVQPTEFGGLIDVYGTQTCKGRFTRDDQVPGSDGIWELFCADDGTYAGGLFRFDNHGVIFATGMDMHNEQISFTLPVPN